MWEQQALWSLPALHSRISLTPVFLHIVNSAPRPSATFLDIPSFPDSKPLSLSFFLILSSLYCRPAPSTPRRILLTTCKPVSFPACCRGDGCTRGPSPAGTCSSQRSHPSCPYSGRQLGAIPAPGKQPCKGKGDEGDEQTGPAARGHMPLPHATEGLCRRTGSQGWSVASRFQFQACSARGRGFSSRTTTVTAGLASSPALAPFLCS